MALGVVVFVGGGRVRGNENEMQSNVKTVRDGLKHLRSFPIASDCVHIQIIEEIVWADYRGLSAKIVPQARILSSLTQCFAFAAKLARQLPNVLVI